MTGEELHRRGVRTMLAAWADYAAAAPAATLARLHGAHAAVFPDEPERSVWNNAVPAPGLDAGGRPAAIDAVEAAYAEAGVERFAVWTREDDTPLRAELERRGYALDTTTRSMGAVLDDLELPAVPAAAEAASWQAHARDFALPGLLGDWDAAGWQVVVLREGGEAAATAIAFDCDGDCGIYNVGTLEPFRRRGLAAALTVRLLHDARERGCVTASLQATPMAERMYASVGLRDLGRTFEYVPG